MAAKKAWRRNKHHQAIVAARTLIGENEIGGGASTGGII